MNALRTAFLGILALSLTYEFVAKDIWAILYLKAHEQQYKATVIQCELAMEAHSNAVNLNDQVDLLAAQQGLAACHEHDVMLKKLLFNGVDENRIRLVGLRGFEDDSIPLKVFIRPHTQVHAEE